MASRSLFFLFPLLLLATRVTAEPIRYTFSGSSDVPLAGEFILDDAATWIVSTLAEGGVTGSLESPIQTIGGTFGDYAFSGKPILHMSDRPAFTSDGSPTFGSDHWIVRAPLTGPSVGGYTPMWLNLFIYVPTAGINNLSLSPPPHSGSPFDFQFTFAFADDRGQFASFEGGQLESLTRVPEPGVLSLLLSAGGSVGAWSAFACVKAARRRKSRYKRAGATAPTVGC